MGITGVNLYEVFAQKCVCVSESVCSGISFVF